MHVFLAVDIETKERINEASVNRPLWFAAPIARASKYFLINRSFVSYYSSALFGGRAGEFLIFNISYKELVLRCFPGFGVNWIALHQWRPDEMLGYWRALAKRLIISRSKLILTYSRVDEVSLREIYPKKNVRWIGHFVDTEFFSPLISSGCVEKYILCVGDHLRLEAIIGFLADQLNINVVRVTRDRKVEALHAEIGSKRVCIRNNVSFSELRDLYANTELVLNAVDDRYWPVGITSFCEALSMNKKIVTSGNHSCSGYSSLAGKTPYLKVNNIFDKEEWLLSCQQALYGVELCDESPRDIAIRLSSLQSMTKQWYEAIDALHAQRG